MRPTRGGGDLHARIQRVTGGPDPQTENHKNIGLLSNTGLDPLKNHSVLGYHRPVSETPFQWRFAGGLMMALL